MKVAVFIVCFILSLGSSWSQVKPIVNLGYGALLIEDRFQEFQLGGGVQLNDHFSLQLNYRYMYYEFDLSPQNEPLKSQFLSISGGCRLLDKNHTVSPLIVLDIGTPILSNANGTFMSNGFRIRENYDLGMWRYNHGIVFNKLKAYCDIRLKSFDILLGGSYNLFVYSKSFLSPVANSYYVTKTITVPMHNFGIEASLMYTFPSKKENN